MTFRPSARIIPFRKREDVYSLESFLKAVDKRRFDHAVHIISELFLLGDSLALETLGRYVERARQEPLTRERLLLIKPLLGEGALEDVIRIIDDCFGIRGMDALWVIQAFQQHQGIKMGE